MMMMAMAICPLQPSDVRFSWSSRNPGSDTNRGQTGCRGKCFSILQMWGWGELPVRASAAFQTGRRVYHPTFPARSPPTRQSRGFGTLWPRACPPTAKTRHRHQTVSRFCWAGPALILTVLTARLPKEIYFILYRLKIMVFCIFMCLVMELI